MTQYHLFLSYARRDDVAVPPRDEGWVTAFHRRLLQQHQHYSGRPLNVFFDRQAIKDNEDWEKRILRGLRTSSLFLAFLSPNYIKSPICRREWEDYLRLEHTLARGDDGIQSIYFVTVPNLLDGIVPQGPDPAIAAWIEEIRRRNLTATFDLRDWFAEGPALLRELDAAARIEDLRAAPRSDRDRSLLALADRVAAIDRAIARRLDRATLADLAPGNLERSYEHFVGRSVELRKIHGGLIADRIGLIGALHGLGGQGKTALAVQYAYAYAEAYAAGGRWLLPAEGRTDLAQVIEPLMALLGLRIAEPPPGLDKAEARLFQLREIMAALRRQTFGAVATVTARLSQDPRRHGAVDSLPEVSAHLLLILDNVDQPQLLSAAERALLAAEDWLQVIVTTRLDPHGFGGDDRVFTAIAVDDLPPEDALALLRAFRAFGSEDERAAARAIVATFGGFTLAIELVGAYLQAKPDVSYRAYAARLAREGPVAADHLADEAEIRRRIRHRQAEVGFIIEDTLALLAPAAREALAFASLLPPDTIVLAWLRAVTATRHPDLAPQAVQPGYPDPWAAIIRALTGQRLMQAAAASPDAAGLVRMARLHRLVGEHVAAAMPPEDRAARVAVLISLIDALAKDFERRWRHEPDLLWQVRPLQDAAVRLTQEEPDSRALARAILVAATAEFTTGQLSSAEPSFEAAHQMFRRLLAANPASAEAAHDVAVSLNRLGDFYLRRAQSGDAERALAALAESLDVSRRLLAANPASAEAASDVAVSLDLLGGFNLRRGQSGDAERALAAFAESLEERQRLLAANPASAEAARDVSLSLDRLGGFYSRRGQSGDAERALAAFEESLEARQRLLAANPASAEAARDAAVSLDRLGDFYLRRGQSGDAERALAAFAESLEARQSQLAANPNSAEAARDVAVSLNRLGDFYLRRGQSGDAGRALAAFEQSLDTSRRLLAANPASAEAARDVAVSLNKLGDFYLRRGQSGDAGRALAAFEQSLDTSRRLLAANPASAEAARDVSISLERLGDFYSRRGQSGDAERALAAFAESLQARQRLLAANPNSAEAARDVVASLGRLGDFYLRRGQSGDAERALDAFAESLDTSRRLLAANPDSAEATRDVSVSLEKLGGFYLRRGQSGDAERALAAFEEMVDINGRLLAANPHSAEAARDVAASLTWLGDFYLRRGQSGDAERALGAFAESLDARQRLLAANPASAEAARDVAVSHYWLVVLHETAGDSKRAQVHFAACHAILDGFVRAGRPMDQEMREVHQSLAERLKIIEPGGQSHAGKWWRWIETIRKWRR